VPEHHVRGLEIRAVKLQHGHSGQTRKCARHQTSAREVGMELQHLWIHCTQTLADRIMRVAEKETSDQDILRAIYGAVHHEVMAVFAPCHALADKLLLAGER
jgi:hypothetical protein